MPLAYALPGMGVDGWLLIAYAGLLLVAVPFGLALARAAAGSDEAERRYVLLWGYSLQDAPARRSTRTQAGREGVRPAAFRPVLTRSAKGSAAPGPPPLRAADGIVRIGAHSEVHLADRVHPIRSLRVRGRRGLHRQPQIWLCEAKNRQADVGIRTRDLLLTMQVLYQLSYVGATLNPTVIGRGIAYHLP